MSNERFPIDFPEPVYTDEPSWPEPDYDDELRLDGGGDEGEERSHHPSLLEETDLARFFSPDGPLAGILEGYELRPSQLQMAEAVKEAIVQRTTAIMEAPTGTGKSLAYLLPAILSGRTVVVATANKSLQNQLYTKDIPFLAKVLKRSINAVLVKGRSNYVCTYKWEQEAMEQRQFSMYDREHDQFAYMRGWLGETDSGDVDDLPFVLHTDLRPKLVSYPDDCLQRDCRFYFDNCWVNKMRDQAANAQILITNHHLLLNVLELGEAGARLLPSASIYVIDEAHGLESTATSVFEVEVTNYALQGLLSRTIFKEHVDAERISDLDLQNLMAFTEVERLSSETTFRLEGDLEEMKKLASQLKSLQDDMRKKHPYQKSDDAKKESEETSEKRAQY